jgi:muramoyltetrapeptide carboxypeptidase LdcA involved in peptidoglycan recycling
MDNNYNKILILEDIEMDAKKILEMIAHIRASIQAETPAATLVGRYQTAQLKYRAQRVIDGAVELLKELV